jgi:hypothetical protein
LVTSEYPAGPAVPNKTENENEIKSGQWRRSCDFPLGGSALAGSGEDLMDAKSWRITPKAPRLAHGKRASSCAN